MSATRMLVASITTGLLLSGAVLWGAPAMAANGVPYTDTNSSGYIGLCNTAGQQVTSGRINAVPFAWLAVSSVPAKAPYNNSSRTATLYAFLPQQGFPAGDWSGETMTATSTYSNPTAPMAAGTARDESLDSFIEAYPPEWDGFIQLRLYLDTTGQPAATKHYPTLDIQVTGNTWHAVDGGTVNCNAGTAISNEVVLGPTTTTTTSGAASTTTIPNSTSTSTGSSTATAPQHGTTGGTGGPSKVGANSAGGATTTSPAAGGGSSHPSGTPGGPAAQASGHGSGESTSGGSAGLIVGIVLGVLVVGGLAAWAVTRRRRAGGRAGARGAPGVPKTDH